MTRVLILAGQRAGVVDPLCEAANVSHKAKLPIAGVPMLDRVVAALSETNLSEPFYVSGYSESDLTEVPSGQGPADSVALGLETIATYPCLVTTCDHALLTAEMVESFIQGAEAAGADICVGLATEEVIQAQYPKTKRTYMRFSDVAVSGCNLFYIANEEGLKAIAFWQSVQHLRKNPIKLARKVGVGIGFKFAAGRLSLKGAFDYAAKRIGITAAPVLLPFAEAAIDVDKPSDLEIVEAILKAANGMSAPDLTIASSQTVGKRIASNTGLMMGSKALSVFLGLFSILIAAKALGAATVGIILFLHSYQLFFAQLATFQAWQTIIRFGMDDVKNQDAPNLAKLLQFGYKLDVISAVIAFLGAVGCFQIAVFIAEAFPGLFARDGEQIEIRELFEWVVLYSSLLLIRHRGASIGVFRLFDRFDILAWHGVIMPAVRFFGVVIAAVMGAGMEGFLLAWFIGSLADYIAMPILAARELAKRHLLWPVLRAKSSILKPRKGIWPFVWKANVDSTLAASNVHLPILLVMAFFGEVWVSVYKIADEVAKLLSEGFKLLDQVIYPELAKMVSVGEASKIWRLVMRAAVILLSVGLLASLVIWLFLGTALGAVLPEEFMEAGPLASLLVPAAALLGMAAPLYPVLYATDHPERAIYARGAGVVVYIMSFFVLSFTIGEMAPGWAAIAGNAVAVGLVMWLAKQALDKLVQRENKTEADVKVAPGFGLIGQSDSRIWGLPIREWQTRAFKKAGADVTLPLAVNDRGLWHHIDWIMSAELSKSFAITDRLALVENAKVVSLSGATQAEAEQLIGQPIELLSGTNFKAVAPSDVNDGYIKSLRKQEAPYVLDTAETPILDIMRRQFKSSYKGITDFVTKWFWPLPAFYVTRFCAWLRLTPNQVTTVGFFLMLAATWFFWNGHWALGFACGWTMTFLDTVDGKLARTTMTYSYWGNIYDHGIDLVHPPFWYWAWFIGLGGVYQFSEPMFIALLAIWVGYVIDRIIEGIFMRQHGFHIHVWTKLNSGLRFFIARRNPNTFIMMIGIILTAVWVNAGVMAFLLIAIWTWMCIAANVVTLIVGCFAKRPLVSWMDA